MASTKDKAIYLQLRGWELQTGGIWDVVNIPMFKHKASGILLPMYEAVQAQLTADSDLTIALIINAAIIAVEKG